MNNLSPKALKFEYSALNSVHLGAPAAQTLGELVSKQGAKRIFIVGSSSLSKLSDSFALIVSEVTQQQPNGQCKVFDQIGSHTPREDVLLGLASARDFGADLLVSIGGGSVIDACKAIQLAIEMDVSTAPELIEYAQQSDGTTGSKAGDFSLFKSPAKIRQIAIPTTLSGAEFSNNAGVLNTQTSSKEGYKGPQLCPQSIVYDPHLVFHTPNWLWFSTAIRSLDHAIEGLCSADSNAFVEGHFLHALKLFAQSLPLAHSDPSNAAARQENQTAVWLACCGLGTISHGASHGIGYILGSLCSVPHGYTSCVMLPAVLQWNAQVTQSQQLKISQALGHPSLPAHTVVKNLIASLGLPTSLQDVDVGEHQLSEIAQRACKHPVVKRNPRSIECPDHVLEILRLAWSP